MKLNQKRITAERRETRPPEIRSVEPDRYLNAVVRLPRPDESSRLNFTLEHWYAHMYQYTAWFIDSVEIDEANRHIIEYGHYVYYRTRVYTQSPDPPED